ncbi:cupin domain-containing protein [Robiginitalea sp. IMCC44478]|uniref:cupin domain-containing protein n=1 Tax=Robiginitalea sp. IMCC44478 TaxID=3459122 RepID=UPI00404302AC
MDRTAFIKTTALGVGMLSFTPLQGQKKSSPPSKTPKIVRNEEGRKLNVIGDNQNIKLTGDDTNGQFTLIEQFNDPGIGIPPHVHENEDEVFQVLSGEVEMTIGDKATTLTAGDLIFCPRGIPHSWRVVGTEKARAMLSIFPAGLEKMFEELSQLPPGPPDLEKVGQICGKYNLRFV